MRRSMRSDSPAARKYLDSSVMSVNKRCIQPAMQHAESDAVQPYEMHSAPQLNYFGPTGRLIGNYCRASADVAWGQKAINMLLT